MEIEPEPDAFNSVLKAHAQLVVENLESGNVTSAVQALFHLNDARDDSLYQQIGRITRGLHDAILKLEFSSDEKGDDNRDVQARVGYVIELTQDAANKTMDLADAAYPIAAELGEESIRLRQEWKRLASREMSVVEFRELYQHVDDFLAYAEDKSASLHGMMSEIVLAQGYQDLSGQVLHKIVNMLNATEADLIKLLALAGRMQEVSGIACDLAEPTQMVKDIQAEGPLPDSAKTLKSQDEVDNLLSSLGF